MDKHWLGLKISSHELAVDWSCNEAVRDCHTFPGSIPARSEGSAIGDRRSALVESWLEPMAVNASGKRLAALASSLIVVLACSALMSSDAESINDLVPNAHIFESFDEGWGNRWFHSSDPKYTGLFMTAPTPGSSNAELKASSPLTCSSTNCMAVHKILCPPLQITQPHKFYGLTALLNKPLDPSEGLVIQYETTYPKGYGAPIHRWPVALHAPMHVLSSPPTRHTFGMSSSWPHRCLISPCRVLGALLKPFHFRPLPTPSPLGLRVRRLVRQAAHTCGRLQAGGPGGLHSLLHHVR